MFNKIFKIIINILDVVLMLLGALFIIAAGFGGFELDQETNFLAWGILMIVLSKLNA